MLSIYVGNGGGGGTCVCVCVCVCVGVEVGKSGNATVLDRNSER